MHLVNKKNVLTHTHTHKHIRAPTLDGSIRHQKSSYTHTHTAGNTFVLYLPPATSAVEVSVVALLLDVAAALGFTLSSPILDSISKAPRAASS